MQSDSDIFNTPNTDVGPSGSGSKERIGTNPTGELAL